MKKEQLLLHDPQDNLDAPKAREMIDLEVGEHFSSINTLMFFPIKAIFDKLDHELKEINTNADALLRNHNELTELKYNLSMTQAFFEGVFHSLMLCYSNG